MKPSSFDYHRPGTVSEALALLDEHGDGAKALAGGQSLVPMLALRLAYFDHLVDISRLDELRGVRRDGDALWVGATTTESAVGADPLVARDVPLLARATPLIGHVQIRNRGTAGGTIAHADPAAEYPAVALALDAEIEAASPRGRRTIPAGEFFSGLWTTALEPDELLTGVRYPVWPGRCGFAVEEFARRHGDFAIAGAVVAVALDDGGRIGRCAIGLFGLGSTPLRAGTAEGGLVGRELADVAAADVGEAAVADLDEIPADLHGSSAYRRRVGAAMVARAWTAAGREASMVGAMGGHGG